MKQVLWRSMIMIYCLIASAASGQTIRGMVTDSLGKAVPFASINLKSANGIIIGFAITTTSGTYQLPFPPNTINKSLSLFVTALGYRKETKRLNGFSAAYDFTLKTEDYRLPTVYIKNERPKLILRGDTLSYKVADFSAAQDRVIGDVIKKLPGISVDAQGRISYNGKIISNFYIEGDDLLDDKYNIATGSIQAQDVDKIEVMQHHQPIKMLKGKIVSDDVAMNITIKSDAKLHLFGQAELGGGVPDKYDANINAMTFKDKFKSINYVKANDIGKDIGNDLIAHNVSDRNQKIDNDDPNGLLSLGVAGTPDLPANRYLFNNASLITLNNLFHLHSDVQIKFNFSYLHDIQKQQYSIFSKTYLNGDTIAFSEKQNNRQSPDLLHLQLNININKENTYFNEALIGDLNYQANQSSLVTNGMGADQHLSNKIAKFYNESNYLLTLNNGMIINFYSYVSHLTKPELLTIDSGLNKTLLPILNNDNNFIQRLNIPTWATNNYFSFKRVLKKITLKYKFGFNTQSQLLQSSLYAVTKGGAIRNAIDSSSNNLSWFRSKLYSDASFDIPGNQLSLSFNLPVILQQTSYSESAYALRQKMVDIYFNPQAKLLYKIGQENSLNLGYSLNNNVGNADDVARGYILKNYRTIEVNSAGLIQQKNQTVDLLLNLRKSAKMLFFYLNTSFSHISANAIQYSIINNNYQQNITLPYENGSNNWTISANVSKYLFFIHATLSGGPVWQMASANQIQNDRLIKSKTQSNGFNLGLDIKLQKKVNFSYKGYIAYSQSTIEGSLGTNFTQFNQQASLFYIPDERMIFTISGEHYYSKQPILNRVNYTFLDFSTRYNLKKNKIQFELNANNLLNTTAYTTSYLLANNFTSSTYRIPGRMVIGKVIFNY
jgi:hypothetical protein